MINFFQIQYQPQQVAYRQPQAAPAPRRPPSQQLQQQYQAPRPKSKQQLEQEEEEYDDVSSNTDKINKQDSKNTDFCRLASLSSL